MTGFIKPNAVNLVDFLFKPIRVQAGGKITTREDDTKLSLFSSLSRRLWAHQTDRDLVKCRQLSWVGVCQNNSLVITTTVDKELFTCMLSSVSQIMLVSVFLRKP